MKPEEELLARLIRTARADYESIWENASFSTEDVEETAQKLTVCKAFLENIENFKPSFPKETAVFLFYEKPISKLYEDFTRQGFNMADILAETLSDLTVGLRREVRALLEQEAEPQEDSDDLER
ncbi:hypothetical protein MCJ35_02975 [Enterocloster sp. OA13]|uniref:hypothetical protein n=1 Tax=Enterocloster sp. OA13 TaxID=2914161 RepID=UPI000471829D|nr:hypothetical protein [Enterocloster sp. OA13]